MTQMKNQASFFYEKVSKMSAENSKKTALGRPFKKGVSGNPGGRPKTDPEVRDILKAHSVDAAKKIVELMDCGDKKLEFLAAQEILNRTQGKPIQPQAVEVSGGLDMRAQIRAVLLERLNGKSDGRNSEPPGN